MNERPRNGLTWIASGVAVVVIAGSIVAGASVYGRVTTIEVRQQGVERRLDEQGDVKTVIALLEANLSHLARRVDELGSEQAKTRQVMERIYRQQVESARKLGVPIVPLTEQE